MTIKKISAAAKTAAANKKPLRKTGAPARTVAKPAVIEPLKTSASVAGKPTEKKLKHKAKIVRDSFTMPQSEYQKIADIKETCLKAGIHVKKSEVLRAGLQALCEKSDAQMKQALKNLEKIRTGRPKKH